MATQTKVAAKSWGFFIDGKWLNEGEPAEIHSPYDHSVVGEVHLGSSAHAETAVVEPRSALLKPRKNRQATSARES